MPADVLRDKRPGAFAHLVNKAPDSPFNTKGGDGVELLRVWENNSGARLLEVIVEAAELRAEVVQDVSVDVFHKHHELFTVVVGDTDPRLAGKEFGALERGEFVHMTPDGSRDFGVVTEDISASGGSRKLATFRTAGRADGRHFVWK